MILLLAAAAAAAQPTGPAILIIQRYDGKDFVPFSSFARCEAARKLLEEEQRAWFREHGTEAPPPTAPTYRCIPG